MEQFDRDAPLFDRRLQVLVQYPGDREEKLQPLTIRLLHGVRVRLPSVLYGSRTIDVVTQQRLTHSCVDGLPVVYIYYVQQNGATNQKERVFRVEITDDDGADPYFLYLWSVSEEEFHELKQQQRLLVDFVTFPTNLIELLQCCLKDSKKALSQHESEANSDAAASVKSDVDVVNPLSRSQGPIPLR